MGERRLRLEVEKIDLGGLSKQFGLPVRSHGLVHVGCLMVDN